MSISGENCSRRCAHWRWVRLPPLGSTVKKPLFGHRFAALGDETRLMLLIKLGEGMLLSITSLTEGSTLTRQAITKHLRILEVAGLVRGVRRGRENLFQIEPKPLEEARDALDIISRQWDDALARLKSFVKD